MVDDTQARWPFYYEKRVWGESFPCHRSESSSLHNLGIWVERERELVNALGAMTLLQT